MRVQNLDPLLLPHEEENQAVVVVHLRVAHGRRVLTRRLNPEGSDRALARKKETLKKPAQMTTAMRTAQTARRMIVKERTMPTKVEVLPPREAHERKRPGRNRREEARRRVQEEDLEGASTKGSSRFLSLFSFFMIPWRKMMAFDVFYGSNCRSWGKCNIHSCDPDAINITPISYKHWSNQN